MHHFPKEQLPQNDLIAVVGGGAAGFFGAITCAQYAPQARVLLLEKTRQVLSKVKISGGGRCNVTHACFDPAVLIQHYPRGGKELRGAFARFQPRDMIAWLQARDVTLKTESDGRMFPTTDRSETIIASLVGAAQTLGVEVHLERGVVDCQRDQNGFILTLSTGELLKCARLLVATGSSPKVSTWLQQLGHTLHPPVPSLFTFNTPHSPLNALAGISVPQVSLSLEGFSREQTGPLLITHWGLSGPAVLKLSAWAARFLHDTHYRAFLKINWLPELCNAELHQLLVAYRQTHGGRLIISESPVPLPKNLWRALVELAQIPTELRWSTLSKALLQQMIQRLNACIIQIEGKSTYKEEFVTCGGVKLQEVNFKTMESRLCPGLYFAGEVLDIDGVTGGFNFQSAWTTGWLAGRGLAAGV